MSRQIINIARFCLFVLGITAVLSLTVHAAPTDQELPRPRFNLEEIPHQPGTSDEQSTESALAVTAPNVLLSWSKVTFQSLRNGNWNIFVGNDDGSGQVGVATTGSSEIHPHLNRGNTKIVYASNSGGDYEIYAMNVDGSGKTALTSNSTSDGNPSWSPDGSKIVFEAYRNGEADIYVMNANGSNQVRLTTDPDFDGMPSWSPDGSKIAFVSRRTGGYRIYVMNADGSGQTQISNQPYSFRPQWSPDGSQIAYDADNDGDGWQDLWRMNADGTSQTQVFNPSGQTDAWASSWSPDGNRIVYTLISFIQYQGNWYWTYAYPDAWGPNLGTTRLSSSGLDWDASWQTSDITPPTSQVNALPSESPGPIPVSWSSRDSGGSGAYRYSIQVKIGNGSWQDWWTDVPNTSRNYPGIGGETYAFRVRARDRAFNYETWPVGADASTTVESLPPSTSFTILPEYSRYNRDLTVSWGGKDPGFSGIKNYDVQYKIGLNGSWVNWKTDTGQTTAVLSGGTAGETYYFRVRGTDRAENTESWTTGTGDGHTTFYRWASYGLAFDNTHTPISGASSTTIPAADSIVPSDKEGSYISYVLDNSTIYTAAWSKPGYGSLSATSFVPEPDGYHSVVLPPTDNIIANWDFETGTTTPEWSSAGTLPQLIASTTQHTGAYSLGFGTPNATAIDNLTQSVISGYGRPLMAVGPNGNAHIIWREDQGPRILYSERSSNGTWTAPIEISSGETQFAGIGDIAVGKDGSVHVVMFVDKSQGSLQKVDIYYTRRNPAKNWSTPIEIYTSPNPYGNIARDSSLLVDDTGIVHLIWEETIFAGISTSGGEDVYYTRRLLNGSWIGATDVSTEYNVDFTDEVKIFQSEGSTHFLWSSDDVFYRRRNANGSWAEAEIIFNANYKISSAFMDEQGVIHLLVTAPVSDAIYYLNNESGWTSKFMGYGDTPKVVSDSKGNVYITWIDPDSSRELYYTKRTPEKVWQTPKVIFNEAWVIWDMLIDSDDKVHIAFARRPNDIQDIFYSWKDANDIWALPTNITGGAFNSYGINMAVDLVGNYHVLWHENSSNPFDEYLYWGPEYSTEAGTGTIIQEVTLSPDLANPVLSFLYQLGGVGPNGDSEFKVTLNGTGGEETIFSTKQSTAGWEHQWVDLSAWANETVTLTFELIQGANNPTAWAYLDEVSLGSTFNDVWVEIESVKAGLGETVPIVISYGNRGGALAENVEFSLSLSPSLVFEGSNVPPTNATTLTWQVGNLPAKGDTQAIVAYVRVKQSADSFTNLTNSVTIATSSNELETLNNIATGMLFTGKDIYLPIVNK